MAAPRELAGAVIESSDEEDSEAPRAPLMLAGSGPEAAVLEATRARVAARAGAYEDWLGAAGWAALRELAAKDWHRRFVAAMSMAGAAAARAEILLQRRGEVERLQRAFSVAATNLARLLVDELPLPPARRRLQPGPDGGIRVGELHIRLLASAGGGAAEDEALHKQAEAELRGAAALAAAPGCARLLPPLVAVVFARGHAIRVAAAAPIDGDSTLLYGRTAAGDRVRDRDATLSALLARVGDELATQPRATSRPASSPSSSSAAAAAAAPLSVDVRVHRGSDGAFHVLGADALLPVLPVAAAAAAASSPRFASAAAQRDAVSSVFRPEFLRLHAAPLRLSCDALRSAVGGGADEEAALAAAAARLVSVAVPIAAARLEARPMEGVVAALHGSGVNLRLLPHVLLHTRSAAARRLLLCEMAARAAKRMWRRLERQLTKLYSGEAAYIAAWRLFESGLLRARGLASLKAAFWGGGGGGGGGGLWLEICAKFGLAPAANDDIRREFEALRGTAALRAAVRRVLGREVGGGGDAGGGGGRGGGGDGAAASGGGDNAEDDAAGDDEEGESLYPQLKVKLMALAAPEDAAEGERRLAARLAESEASKVGTRHALLALALHLAAWRDLPERAARAASNAQRLANLVGSEAAALPAAVRASDLAAAASVLVCCGREEAALAAATQSRDLYASARLPEDLEYAHVLALLAEAHARLGQWTRCAEVLRLLDALQVAVLPPTHASRADTQHALAEALLGCGQLEEALAAAEAAVAARVATTGAESAAAADSIALRGRVRFARRELEAAVASLSEALRIRMARVGPASRAAADTLVLLGAVLQDARHWAEALNVHKKAAQLLSALEGSDSLAAADALGAAGEDMLRLQRHKEAVGNLRHAASVTEAKRGEGHPDAMRLSLLLSQALEGVGKHEEALRVAQRVLAVVEQRRETSDGAAHVLSIVQRLQLALGRTDDALASQRRCLAAVIAASGPDSRAAAAERCKLGSLLEKVGHDDEAVACYREALATERAQPQPDAAAVAAAASAAAAVLARRGRHSEAEPLLRATLDARLQVLGPAHPSVGDAAFALASSLEALGQLEEAVAEFRRDLGVTQVTAGASSDALATKLALLANGPLYKLGRFDEAERLLRRALAIAESQHGPRSTQAARLCMHLAVSLAAQGRAEEGAAVARRAVRDVEAAVGAKHADAQQARAVLRRVESGELRRRQVQSE